MNNKIISFLLITILFISCKTDSNKIEDGTYKAYIESYNTETDEKSQDAARVAIANGVVKKIYFSNGKIIDNFDFWETKNNKLQDVYSTGDEVYTVHIIPDEEN